LASRRAGKPSGQAAMVDDEQHAARSRTAKRSCEKFEKIAGKKSSSHLFDVIHENGIESIIQVSLLAWIGRQLPPSLWVKYT